MFSGTFGRLARSLATGHKKIPSHKTCKGTIISIPRYHPAFCRQVIFSSATDTLQYVTYTRRHCLLFYLQQCSSRGKFGYLSERKKAHSRWPLLSDRKQYLIEHDHSFWFVWFDWSHVCNLFIILGMLVGNVKGFLSLIFSLIFSSWYFQIIRNFTYCKHFASTKPRNL